MFSGGIASGTAILSGGTEFVLAGGIENATTIDGFLDLQGDVSEVDGTLNADGTLIVESGANITVSGDRITVLSAGASAGTIADNGGIIDIRDGGTVTIAGGTVTGIEIESGSTEIVRGEPRIPAPFCLAAPGRRRYGFERDSRRQRDPDRLFRRCRRRHYRECDRYADIRSGGNAFGTVVDRGGTLNIFGGAVVSGGITQRQLDVSIYPVADLPSSRPLA